MIQDSFKEAVIGSSNPTLNDLRDDADVKMFIFSGYDGTILSNKKKVIANWHGTGRYINDMQALPKFLRTFSGDYEFFQSISIKLWQAIFAIKYFIYEPSKAKAIFRK